MTDLEIIKKIAYLEFVHDQLSSELEDIDILLKQVGFPRGLESAKMVALEMLKKEEEEE